MSENRNKDAEVQNKLAAMFSASKDEVCIPKIYIDMTGGYKAAAVLDELMFWTLPKRGGKTSLRVYKQGSLWLAVRRADWRDRKRLTERQSDGAISKLIELDLIEKDVFLFDGKPTVHIHIKMSNFVKLYGEKIQELAEEDGDVDMIKDISDLYEMMGFPNETVISNLPNGEMLNLPNGEFINSPQQPPNTTIPFLEKKEEEKQEIKLTEEDYKEAGEKVMEILRVNSGRSDKWDGREYFNNEQLPYADWYHNTTNQVCKKKTHKSWRKAFGEWKDEGLETKHLQMSYDADVTWKGVIGDPNELTKKAVAYKASTKGQVNTVSTPKLDDNGIVISY